MSGTAWEELLDRFENDLDSARDAAPWHPPAEPLPAELADRAREVLRRQQQRITAISAEQASVAQQLTALRRVPDAAVGVPAFLDVDS
ncbi:hypothetical protein [Microbacterium suwonense]|uniref:Uncharacterized protein n=1 Tax=Microbacterium suwonense TaxID=683047 RepID=A0ABM8FU32_9MICO|nr:hypothetical protein [Microbacterium suwonense]BDZ39181.1 hypothetical protein GCM10025863_17950 [Microbacterium suwonense]